MIKCLIPGLLCALNFWATASAIDDRLFKVTSQRDTDRVDVKVSRDNVVFSIHCPVGISQAVVECPNGKWPATVILNLHLKGLEYFKLSNDNLKLEASLSTSCAVRLWKDGNEQHSLDCHSPYWIKSRLIGDDGKPAMSLPLQRGYIELQLPRSVFADHPKSITLHWIDFYR